MSKNRFREISLSVHKIAKFEYFAKVIIYIFEISRPRALK